MRINANPETVRGADIATVLLRQRERQARELAKHYEQAVERLRPRRLYLADAARRNALSAADGGGPPPKLIRDTAAARGLTVPAYIRELRTAIELSDDRITGLDLLRQQYEAQLAAAGTPQALAKIGAALRAALAAAGV